MNRVLLIALLLVPPAGLVAQEPSAAERGALAQIEGLWSPFESVGVSETSAPDTPMLKVNARGSPLVTSLSVAMTRCEVSSTPDQATRLAVYSHAELPGGQYSTFSLQRSQNWRRKTGAFDYPPMVGAVLGGGLLGSLGAGLGGGPGAGLGGGIGCLTGAVLGIHLLPYSDRLLTGGMFGFPLGVTVGAASSGGSAKDVALGLVGGGIGFLTGLMLGAAAPAIF